MNRALLGFLLAPLTPCIATILIAIFQGSGSGLDWSISVILLISYIISAVIGFPVHILLTRTNHRNLLYYVVAGIVAALIPIFFIFLFPNGTSSPWAGLLPVHFKIMGLMILYGVLISTAFWFIARPDQHHNSESGA